MNNASPVHHPVCLQDGLQKRGRREFQGPQVIIPLGGVHGVQGFLPQAPVDPIDRAEVLALVLP